MSTTRHDVLQAIKKAQTLFVEYTKEMRAELAETEKPKRRHGDYGYAGRREKGGGQVPSLKCCLLNHLENGALNSYEDGGYNYETSMPMTKLGNIFDDLRAIAKPLEEINAGGIIIKKDSSGGLNLDPPHGRHFFHVEKAKVATFILNLRRLAATAERAKNG